MERRVVITGMGAVSPVGLTARESWDALVAGTSGIAPIANISTDGLKVTVAAEVNGFDGAERLGEDVRHKDLNVQYALAASEEAMQDAGFDDAEDLDRSRIGVYIGSGIGGMASYTAAVDTMREEASIRHHLTGPTLPVVTACATSAHTVGEAFHAIKHGYADAVLAGGAEACIVPEAIAGFTNCKALTRNPDPATACRPFDKNRDGFVMGEGACVLVLEELEHALARGAHIYCEVAGYGNTADAYHITSPAPDAAGITRAIRIAIEEARIDTTEGIYINAHGTSTKLNDASETLGIKQALGEDAARTAHISSTKSMTGHMLGATGALEAAVCARVIEEGIIPPTIGYCEPDPDCDLDYTPNHAITAPIRTALSTNLGFGGHNAALAFKAYED